MKQFYPFVFVLLMLAQISQAQSPTYNCANLNATYTTMDSRCAATGSITMTASGGSGNYSYKVVEPFVTPLTSTSTISGLPPGTYSVYVKDMVSGCTRVTDNIVVGGSYSDPRFQLTKLDLTCATSNDGGIDATAITDGRAPFTFTIISPSPASVGVVNPLGSFTGLPAGYYFIQLKDSCGGIQTRSVAVSDYSWAISAKTITKLSCNLLSVSIELLDNKGNTNTASLAFIGFQYGWVNGPADTTWGVLPSFLYPSTPLRTTTFVVKDRCGSVQSFTWSPAVPTLGSNVTLSNYACNTFDAAINGASNLTSPQYKLLQGATVIASNTTGSFGSIPYGSYCIEMKDNCYDTTITRCFTVNPKLPSVAPTVTISGLSCSTFTSSITGVNNLFNPTFCIFDNTNTQLSCNTTGVFTGLPYGSYCVRITTPCYDTTIERCFTQNQPIPVIPLVVTVSNVTCDGFDASMGGTNVFTPTYCLYDSVNTLLYCNTTGVFPGLTFGSYCIHLTMATPCFDTTITRCFSVAGPVPSAAAAVISNKACNTFTASITSVTNIPSPEYCLFDEFNAPLGCNSTGVFNNLAYGTYSITIVTTSTTSMCAAVPVTKTFTVNKPVRTVAANLTIGSKACATFSATVTGQTNFMTPEYNLYDNTNTIVQTNNTGAFTNIPYGDYVIRITDVCLDTVIERSISVNRDPIALTASASESCTIGTTNIKLTITTGQAPFHVDVYNPVNMVVASYDFSTTTFNMNDLPALGAGYQYRIELTSACGENATLYVTPKASIFNRNNNVTSKCPSAHWANGSGEIISNLYSNLGMYSPVVVKKNGALVNIAPSLSEVVSTYHNRYTFSEMEPAVYVIQYTISSCSKTVYDTVTVSTYVYPNLSNSAAYQCDNNNFSVNAVGGHGVAPFTYEIIGSNPVGPSIITAAQLSSIFDITTSSPYSLVRMRAVDACGNGTLNDVSVLPLGNLSITSSNIDCYSNYITLNVDTIPNATYTWYRKLSPTDSVMINTSQSYTIPYLLPSDTGTYVCKTVVNNGCLMRLSYYDIQGDCDIILPVKLLSFEGKLENGRVPLKWKATEERSISHYVVERKSAHSNSFEEIGSVNAVNSGDVTPYNFTDQNPGAGSLQYRLRIVTMDGKVSYSNILNIQNEADVITAGPNPVKDVLTIQINAKKESRYAISLVNTSGQVMNQQVTGDVTSTSIQIQRTKQMSPGMYILRIENKTSGYLFTKKLLFQ